MHLIENSYEKSLLYQLPPHARDVAEHLLAIMPLAKLLSLWQDTTPDMALLENHKVPDTLWMPILSATLLAKTTYFSENKKFTQEEILYLIKIACASAGMPLNTYDLKDVILMSRTEMPAFYDWLLSFTNLLKQAQH